MGVIINDFEIVPADPATQQPGASPAAAAPPPAITSQEIIDVARRFAERMARLRAH